MTNFLAETIRDIADSGHTPEDIIFIGSTGSGHACTWSQFLELADFDYDAGYGAAYIASDLLIVFSDGADMHRSEYDGSEWWDYSRPFVAPEVQFPIVSLYNGDLWPSLADQQKQGGDS